MEFDNDPAKAALNLKKHKVSFEEAASKRQLLSLVIPWRTRFADPDHSISEERWLLFGLSRMARVLAISDTT